MSETLRPLDCTDDLPETTDTHGNVLAVGDIVLSFDFPEFGHRDHEGEDACYVVGRIKGVSRTSFPDCPRYVIVVHYRRFAGELRDPRPGELVCPPLNGTKAMFGGLCDGVELAPDTLDPGPRVRSPVRAAAVA